jgi:acyl dehydratase
MKFFDEIAVGDVTEIGMHHFTADDIKRFASAFDPQPFHTDEKAAEASHFGRLCASGWHTLAVWMKLNVRAMQQMGADRAVSGSSLPRLVPSPGFDELKWLKPVYAGDRITFSYEVVGKRTSRSRPGWGLVSIRNSGRNEDGVEVISFTGHVFVEARQPVEAEGR